MSNNTTAAAWISTDCNAVASDIARLGLDGAAEYQMGLIADCQAAGDRRWDNITVDDMRAAMAAI